MITVSVVSHGQGELAGQLLQDFRAHCAATPLQVLLTLNIEEHLPFDVADFPFEIRIIRNPERRGFAANHNAAFAMTRGEYFCVLNPDIRLDCDPFLVLVSALADPSVGVAGPLVLSADGRMEDSVRRFPTPLSILRKVFRHIPIPDYVIGDAPIYPDWIAGMFMLWRRSAFRAVGGFDEHYFLYYEDVDICARLPRYGFRVIFVPGTRVTHHARRASHRSLRYLRWHLGSMLRFFWKRFVS